MLTRDQRIGEEEYKCFWIFGTWHSQIFGAIDTFLLTPKKQTFSYTKKQTVRQGKFTTPFGHKVIKVAYWAIEIHKWQDIKTFFINSDSKQF